jgi:hypothetical protein
MKGSSRRVSNLWVRFLAQSIRRSVVVFIRVAPLQNLSAARETLQTLYCAKAILSDAGYMNSSDSMYSVTLIISYMWRLGERRKVHKSILCDHDVIFDTDSKFFGKIDPRLDGEHHPLPDFFAIDSVYVGWFMDL